MNVGRENETGELQYILVLCWGCRKKNPFVSRLDKKEVGRQKRAESVRFASYIRKHGLSSAVREVK